MLRVLRVPHVFRLMPPRSPLEMGGVCHAFLLLCSPGSKRAGGGVKGAPPKNPQHEPKADEKPLEEQREKEAGQLPDTGRAGVAKSDAEMGQQPPVEAATAGEEMEMDEIVQI